MIDETKVFLKLAMFETTELIVNNLSIISSENNSIDRCFFIEFNILGSLSISFKAIHLLMYLYLSGKSLTILGVKVSIASSISLEYLTSRGEALTLPTDISLIKESNCFK